MTSVLYCDAIRYSHFVVERLEWQASGLRQAIERSVWVEVARRLVEP
jgi:hypothetical protein